MADAEQTYFVAYAPYLPLADFQTVGPWRLIPRDKLEASDAAVARPVELAEGFANLFELPTPPGSRCGAFVYREGAPFGTEPPNVEKAITDLYAALTVGIIDGNPSALDDEHDPNAGHRSVTSENARIIAARIGSEGYTSLILGSRVPQWNLGVYVGEDRDWGLPRQTFPHPADLRIPSMGHVGGFGYADAAVRALEPNTAKARRLRRAILWLALAWLNTQGFTDDLRVPALRAGFEVLLNHESSLELARRLGSLLQDRSPRVRREWKVKKESRSANLSDVSWWFMRFSFLRNAFMHGTEPSREAWHHDDLHHVPLALAYLAAAIKATVAKDNPTLARELDFQRRVKQVQRERREGKL